MYLASSVANEQRPCLLFQVDSFSAAQLPAHSRVLK